MEDYGIRTNNVGLKIHAGIIEEMAKKQIDLIVSRPVYNLKAGGD